MKRHCFIYIVTLLSVLVCVQVHAGVITFEELRKMADKGTPEVVDVMYSNRVPLGHPHVRRVTHITDKLYLDGLVAASPRYPRHANNEMPYNTASYEIWPNISMAVAYLESEDGKYGVKLMFPNERQASALLTFGKAEISLKGLTLVKEGNCYVLEGCTSDHIIYSEPGVVGDMPLKERYVSELTDDDLYTYVTIKDCEFVFKNGAFGNTIEESLTRTAAGRNQGAGRADGWQRLIMDAQGGMIYFHVNAKMTNRRIGGGVPQGVGRLCGTLVDTYNPRFGHTSVKYGIRPHCDEDVLMEWMGQPGYKTIAAWDWNVNRNPGFIPAEYGAGYMTSDLPELKINRVDDWDNPFIDLPDERADSRGLRGAVTNGAMQLEARSCDWWDFDKDCGRSLTLMCSTRKAVGTDLFIGFTVSAGNRTTDTTYGYPSFWKVQWSLDGVDFTDVSMQDINVKALWHDWFGPAVRQVDGEHYELSYEAAIGFAEHLVHLPASLLGQEKLFLKITPAKKIVASVGYMHRDNVALRPGMTEKCYVNFGEIIIGYR